MKIFRNILVISLILSFSCAQTFGSWGKYGSNAETSSNGDRVVLKGERAWTNQDFSKEDITVQGRVTNTTNSQFRDLLVQGEGEFTNCTFLQLLTQGQCRMTDSTVETDLTIQGPFTVKNSEVKGNTVVQGILTAEGFKANSVRVKRTCTLNNSHITTLTMKSSEAEIRLENGSTVTNIKGTATVYCDSTSKVSKFDSTITIVKNDQVKEETKNK